MLLLLIAPSLACPDLREGWNRALDAAVAAETGGITAGLASVEAAMGCRPLEPTDVARAWVVHALAERAQGRDPSPWMRAARRLAPTLHDPRIPTSLWRSNGTDAPASVGVEPAGSAMLDGVPTTAWPVSTTDGPHLLQILGSDGAVRLARTFQLLPGEDALVETHGVTGVDPSHARPSADVGAARVPRARRPGLRAATLASALGAGAFALAALGERDRLERATDLTTLDAAHQRQVIWASGSWFLAATTAILLGLELALPERAP
jgi:hypothetical protein